MVQLGRLEGFYWVARSQGYARAARAFPYPITEPGVHQQVKKLEAELGVRLFERAGKDRMLLTPPGRALYAFVAPFLEQLPAVTRSLGSTKLGGTLRIHASGLLLRHLLPAWLRKLQSRHPEILLSVSEAKTADPGLLRSGESDLLVDHFAELPEDLSSQRVGTVRAFVAVPSRHPAARQARTRLEVLKDEPFIAYNEDRRLRELQLQALSLHRLTPQRMLLADSSDAILGFVAAGLGYSLVPSVLPNGPVAPGIRFHPLLHPPAEFPVHAVWRKSALENALVQAAVAVAPKG